MSTRTHFTETLGIISILLLFSGTFLMFIGIFYYKIVWIGLMLFITGMLVAIYALYEAHKQSNEINEIKKIIS